MSIAIALSPLTERIRRPALPSVGVTVYGTLWSLKTHRLCRHLARAGVPYTDINIDFTPAADRYVRDHVPSGTSYPVVSVDGDWLLDPSIELLDKTLTEHGWL